MEDQMQTKTKQARLSGKARTALEAELPGLEAALARLLPHFDVGSNECSCCGLRVQRNFADHQAAESVEHMLKRIARLKREITTVFAG
jgi:hypothetical protein